MSIGGHHSPAAKSVVWLSPRYILDALGPFDLDPCAAEQNPTRCAPRYFTESVDGLSQEWSGRVWLNPPYGKQTGFWLNRLAAHGNGVALIFARTETDMFFHQVWAKADAVHFFHRRLHFCHKDGSVAKANSGAPSVLVAYGRDNVRAINESGLPGKLIKLK